MTRQQNRLKAAVSSGLCSRCGVIPVCDAATCNQCKVKRREYNARRKSSGLCYCGRELSGGGRCRSCNDATKLKHYELVRTIISHYGGVCQCCHNSRLACLTIDHIYGSGTEHRKEVGLGSGIYRWLLRNDMPAGFAVLCANCNHGKARNGGVCPHFGVIDKTFDTNVSLNNYHSLQKIQTEVIEAYGGKCVVCAETMPLFLHLDHVNGDGYKHRSELGSVRIERWAKRNGCPPTLQILCANCNLAKQRPHFNGVTLDGR